jgi:gamma-glutamyltranspeptidase/glutathione hydrolase
MTPLIVLRAGAPVWTAGGAGGPTIISGTLLATLAALDFHMDPSAAVSAPRVHHQWMPDVLTVDPEVPADVVDALKAMGHTVKVEPVRNVVQAIALDPVTGLRTAASDPRKHGGGPAGY